MGRPKKRTDAIAEPQGDTLLSSPSPDSSEVPAKKRRGAFIPLKEDGSLDVDRLRPAQAEQLEAVKRALAQTVASEVSVPQLCVTEEHVKFALQMYSKGCAWMVPQIIYKQSKGLVKIEPALASRVYQFTPQQLEELSGPGAQFFNEQLPDWLKKWLLEIGPGAQFFGGLAMITWAQTQQVLIEWKTMHATEQPVKPNGEAKVVTIPDSMKTEFN